MPSVTSCNYDRSTAEAVGDENNMGTYTIGFLVQTDGLMGPQSVYNAALVASPVALPSRWSTYSYQGDVDNYSWAREVRVTRDPNSFKIYRITITYKPAEPGAGSQDSGGDPINAEPNPLLREPIVWWDREVNTRIIYKDKDGKAIRNKCEDYYQTDIEIEEPKGILVVEFNVGTLAEVYDLKRIFDGAVNQQSWSFGGRQVAQRAVLCREVSASPPQTEQAGYVYFHVTMRLAFAPDGKNWDHEMPEYGEFYWKKENNEYVMLAGHRQVFTDEGKIVPLDSDGTRLDDGEDIVFTSWRIRREVDFSLLDNYLN